MDTPFVSNNSASGTALVLDGVGDPYGGQMFGFDGVNQLLPLGMGYGASPSQQSLRSEAATEDTRSYDQYQALHMPFAVAPACGCLDNQLSHVDGLRQVVASGVMPSRFDDGLEKVRSALSACQVFLECTNCCKESTNVSISLSIVGFALQLFERWVSCGTTQMEENGQPVQYGSYELSAKERWRVRNLLIEGLLLRYKEMVTMIRLTIDTWIAPQQKLAAATLSLVGPASGERMDQQLMSNDPWWWWWWWASDQMGLSVGVDTDEGNGLGQRTAHYEARVDELMRLAGSNLETLI